MRPTHDALVRAVEVLAQGATDYHGHLRIAEEPAEVLVRDGMSDGEAAWIVAMLTRQGVLVPLPANGAAASIEIRPEAFTGEPGAAVPTTATPRRIAVFVDYPNVAGTLRNRGEVLVVDNVRRVLRDIGEIRAFRVFLDASRVPQEVLQDLHDMGVAIEHCPRMGDSETVDKLLVERVAEALESDAYDTIAVAANDNDYARDVFRRVRDRQRLPILLLADPTGSAALKEAAGGQFRCIGGSAFMPDVASFFHGVASAESVADVAAIAALHPVAADAVVEIIRFAATVEGRRRHHGKAPRFARKYLRDRMRQDHRTDVPHVATPEEHTSCILRLCDVGAFTPRVVEEQEVAGQFIVADPAAHPLVAYAMTGALVDASDDASARDGAR